MQMSCERLRIQILRSFLNNCFCIVGTSQFRVPSSSVERCRRRKGFAIRRELNSTSLLLYQRERLSDSPSPADQSPSAPPREPRPGSPQRPSTLLLPPSGHPIPLLRPRHLLARPGRTGRRGPRTRGRPSRPRLTTTAELTGGPRRRWCPLQMRRLRRRRASAAAA